MQNQPANHDVRFFGPTEMSIKVGYRGNLAVGGYTGCRRRRLVRHSHSLASAVTVIDCWALRAGRHPDCADLYAAAECRVQNRTVAPVFTPAWRHPEG